MSPSLLSVGPQFLPSFSLLENIRQKYLANISNISEVQILPLSQLCKELNIKWDRSHPRNTLNKVIAKLSSAKTHGITIFLCDEIPPCWFKGQTTPDWRDVITQENVQWILSFNPRGYSYSEKTLKITFPIVIV